MNGLSILIYVVGLAEKVEMLLPNFFPGILMVMGLSGFGYLAAKFNEDTFKEFSGIAPIAARAFKTASYSLAFCLVLNFLFPTKQTMILIAASEVSETVIKSETAQKALSEVGGVSSDAVNLLKSYIAQEQAEIAKQMAETVKETITK